MRPCLKWFKISHFVNYWHMESLHILIRNQWLLYEVLLLSTVLKSEHHKCNQQFCIINAFIRFLGEIHLMGGLDLLSRYPLSYTRIYHESLLFLCIITSLNVWMRKISKFCCIPCLTYNFLQQDLDERTFELISILFFQIKNQLLKWYTICCLNCKC